MNKTEFDMNQLHYAFGSPEFSGQIKSVEEDFVVEEVIDYPLSGSGEHLWCWVEKKNQNTDWVAGQLAKWAQTSKRNVGYAGKKDRRAVTRQWFSICLPGKPDPDVETLKLEGVKILQLTRHDRKLQRGGLAGNQFKLRVRNIHPSNGQSGEPVEALETRLKLIQTKGVPNYFGAQRFGRNGNNLHEAEKLFKAPPRQAKNSRGKKNAHFNQQNLYISAARSWVFNLILSQRVAQKSWDQLVSGDVLNLNGSAKWFSMFGEAVEDLQARLAVGDLHPTAPLIGDGEAPTKDQAREIELSVETAFSEWLTALQNRRVRADRRALRVIPRELSWQWYQQPEDEVSLELTFFLPSGSYATALVRELLNMVDPDRA